ncbi:MAG: hypothetical protein KJP23_00815 [Deltaproteobacteria bacterium]|nr:hypothetical protein [Deltaproteobacteria bacterium]
MTKKKAKPDLQYQPSPPLSRLIRQSLKDDELRRQVKISLHVSGGQPSQRYQYRFEAAGDGSGESYLECRLTDRKTGKKFSMESDRFGTLLTKIHQSGVLEMPQEQPQFLPDTVVGCLEVRILETSYRTYFAADEDQAKVQNKSTTPALKRVVEAIYKEGSRLLKQRSVKP